MPRQRDEQLPHRRLSVAARRAFERLDPEHDRGLTAISYYPARSRPGTLHHSAVTCCYIGGWLDPTACGRGRGHARLAP